MLMGVGRFLHCACILKPGVFIHVYEEVCVYLLVHNPYACARCDVRGGVYLLVYKPCMRMGMRRSVYLLLFTWCAHGYREVCAEV